MVMNKAWHIRQKKHQQYTKTLTHTCRLAQNSNTQHNSTTKFHHNSLQLQGSVQLPLATTIFRANVNKLFFICVVVKCAHSGIWQRSKLCTSEPDVQSVPGETLAKTRVLMFSGKPPNLATVLHYYQLSHQHPTNNNKHKQRS